MATDDWKRRADDAAEAARVATLDNVRNIALRSEATWREVGARLMRTAELSRERTEEKIAAQSAAGILAQD